MLDDRAPLIAKAAEVISNYLLPFFLYLFLLVLLTDILLLTNKVTGIFDRQRIRDYVFTYRYFTILLSLSVIVVIGGIINLNTIRTTHYSISWPGKKIRENLRIAFVSDFHLEQGVPYRFVEKYVNKVNEISPDVVLYGGDIVEGSGENIPEFEALLRDISAKYGTFGALGNHDRIRDFSNSFFTRSGIVLLRDSLIVIDSSYVIAGRNDSRNSRKDAAEILKDVPDLPVILIDHRPTDYDNISKTGAFLVLSGHTHKGQLFPINLYLRNIYELSHGYMKKGNTHFIVSSGIRLWGPKVRTTGKSEIVIVDIR